MKNSRSQFISLVLFLLILFLLLTNGFAPRIFAQGAEQDVYQSIEPIGDVLHEIRQNYVEEPDMDKLVEGAIRGIMSSLDAHSSYLSKDALENMQHETSGSFDGIGVTIEGTKEGLVKIIQPLPGTPASEVDIQSGDLIVKVDHKAIKGMPLEKIVSMIRGPRGTMVHLTLLRKDKEGNFLPKPIEVDVKRGKIPIESITEARILPGGIAYIRVSDFKETTAGELRKKLNEFKKQGMKSFVLDLRWNPGGLLLASRDVCNLFLPPHTLVTYTRGRHSLNGDGVDDSQKLFTRGNPILSKDVPMIVLTNEVTASAAEIVTGALQYYARAIVVGAKTYGKGSVQTIIPLRRPAGAALRLTTAKYYTPAHVTIDKEGILPDVSVPMDLKESVKLWRQMLDSYREDPSRLNAQNHGSVTGDPVTDKTIEDVQLKRAVEILRQGKSFADIVKKYHRDPHETQREAPENKEKDAAAAEKAADSLQKKKDKKEEPAVAPGEKQ